MLKQKLQEDLKSAMLAHDELRVSVLRLLKSAIGYYEINKGGAGYEASDEDVLSVTEKEVKQRRDSIEQYTAGGRQDLADKESAELEILKSYLPAQMPMGDVHRLIAEAIAQTNATSIREIGKVMGVLMPQLKGKTDLGLVSKIVREKLQV